MIPKRSEVSWSLSRKRTGFYDLKASDLRRTRIGQNWEGGLCGTEASGTLDRGTDD